MLETVSAERLVRRCAVACGFTAGVPSGGAFAERLADCVNEAIARVWGKARWPQLVVYERRWYRPQWDEGEAYEAGQECRHGGKYWRAVVDDPVGPPSAAWKSEIGNRKSDGASGGATGEAADQTNQPISESANQPEWEEVDVATMAKFVALDQPWERHAIALRGVDLNAFAFARDPRRHPEAAPLAGCRWAGDYPGGGATRVILPPEAPASVVVRYLPIAPRISLEAWRQGTTYGYGERVLHNGECWRCLAEGVTEEPLEDCGFGPWERVRVPEFLVPCIRAYVAAAFMEDEQGRARAYGRADSELEALRELYCGGTGVFADAAFGGYGED